MLKLLLILFIVLWFFNQKESFATSPGTMIQLSASSGYYPFWRYQWGYRWPYYKFIHPYYANHATSYYNHAHFPRPHGWYKSLHQ